MKKIITVLLIAGLLLTLGCARKTEAPATQSGTEVQALLASAQTHLDTGSYDEAILDYSAAIEIEPKNYDAYMGMGAAYYGKGDADKAVKAYKAAQVFSENNDEPTNAIIQIYNDTDQPGRAEAEIINLEDTTSKPAIIAIFKSLDNTKATESIINIASDQTFLDSIEKYKGDDGSILVADENGFGVGIYPNGYVYIGAYQGGSRHGNGNWYYSDAKSYYTGQWVNDAPNGKGDICLNVNDSSMSFIRKCTLVDGLANGAVDEDATIAGEKHHWTYSVSGGTVAENESAACTTCQIVYALLPGEQVGVSEWIN